ncbi:MAG: hypothetical protein R3F35_15705 [Myxococcota bacterium]
MIGSGTGVALPAVALPTIHGASGAVDVSGETSAIGPEGAAARLEQVIERLRRSPPALFFAAFVVASLLPFPIALFYMASGAAFGVGPSLLWFAGALVISNLLLHAGSRGVLHQAFQRLAARRGHRIPDFDSPLDEALFILLVRLTPGIPYFLQNVILAAARLDLVRFVVLSVAIQMIYATGFIVLGRSAFDGSLVWLLAALAFLVALTVAARLLARRRATPRDVPDRIDDPPRASDPEREELP